MGLIGYARVSTEDQEASLQIDALRAAGCERVFVDKASGARSSRPALDDALRFLRPGDILVVWKLDRLGRTMRHLVELINGLSNGDVGFKSLTEAMDTSTPAGQLLFHVMAALAQFELDLIRERTRAGLRAARARGKITGRPRVTTDDHVLRAQRMIAQGLSVQEVARIFRIGKSTLYAALAEQRHREGEGGSKPASSTASFVVAHSALPRDRRRPARRPA